MKIYNFKDYRDFLKFTVEEFKKNNKSFSYQQFATKVGCSKSYLKLIIEKKNHASLDRMFEIADFFKLNDLEKQYVIFLFLENTTQAKKGKSFFSSILRSYPLVRSQSQKTLLKENPKKKQDFSWVKISILGLMSLEEFILDHNWIQEKLGGADIVSLADISTALRQLEKEEAYEKVGTSVKLLDHGELKDALPWDDDFARNRQMMSLQRTEVALRWFGKNNFHDSSRYHMYCFPLSNSNLEKMMKAYDDFQEKIERICKESQVFERLVFLSNNAFCVSRKNNRP